MKQDSLDTFIKEIRRIWHPLDSELVAKARFLMGELANTYAVETNRSLELHRDPEHGFILLAHKENVGHYRPPHDHGNGWVIYAVSSGEMEMCTYGLIDGTLVRRDRTRMRKGEANVYLPGDIHDTRCISDSVVMLRLTSCDLIREKQEGRMHQYD